MRAGAFSVACPFTAGCGLRESLLDGVAAGSGSEFDGINLARSHGRGRNEP